LDSHYRSDLARLEAIAEAGNLFPPLTVDICPLCGASRTSHSHPDDQISTLDMTRVRQSCFVEKAKIELLRTELQQTLNQLRGEIGTLSERIANDDFQLQHVAQQIQVVLKTSVSEAEAEHQVIREKRYQVKQAASLSERVLALEKRHSTTLSALETAGSIKPVRADIPPSNLERFREEFEALLKAWQFPVDGRIWFDTKREDFVLGSRRRNEQGKGSRALTHAAFSIALMQACDAQQLPHPGLVALDSPLVTFRDRDKEGRSQSDLSTETELQVKDAFYRDLTARAGRRQIIIFENEEPKEESRAGIVFHHFTGDPALPRCGFIPNSSPAESSEAQLHGYM
jgi:hypothetical protein